MSTESAAYKRRYVKNFFIKKDLQKRYIYKIILSVVLAAAITTGILGAFYYAKSGTGYFYFMSNNLNEELQRQNMLQTILPSLLVAELVSILIGFWIGLFSSRKLAVPIYKIETWIAKLKKGDLNAKIGFREKGEFSELCTLCNSLSDKLHEVFSETDQKLSALEKNADAGIKKEISEIREKLKHLGN